MRIYYKWPYSRGIESQCLDLIRHFCSTWMDAADIEGVGRASLACLVRTTRLPAPEVVGYLHGRRASDAIDRFLLGISPERRLQEIEWVESFEMQDTADVMEVPGARSFLMSLPVERWAVATSAARRLAIRRFEAAELPIPSVLIAAEDVAVGKPDRWDICLPQKGWVSIRRAAWFSKIPRLVLRPVLRPEETSPL